MSHDATKNLNDVMRKYDRESNTRAWEGKPKIAVQAYLAAFAIFEVYVTLFGTMLDEVRLTSFVGGLLIAGFLIFPSHKHEFRVNYVPWYDWVIMALGAVSFFYFCFNANTIVQQLPALKTYEVVLGVIGILALFELCRRSTGVPIMIVAGVFIAYALYYYGVKRGLGAGAFKSLVCSLFYKKTGILSTPINVCSKYIAVFIIFGAFLERTGISDFFIQLANSLAGSSAGGPAKVAVISSALCGMVSGSSVGNTVTTGSVTIPMMKKTGYRGEFAGAVEAAASTGGQIMPPIMGAAAFIMADVIGVSYLTIAKAALIPSVLYYLTLLAIIHLEAVSKNMGTLPPELVPSAASVLRRLYYLSPLVFLITILLMGRSVIACAYYGTVCIVILSMIRSETRFTFKRLCGALELSAKNAMMVSSCCACAGIIIGVISLTGIGYKFINVITALAGSNLLLLMSMLMVTCIILGMGVPTAPAYIIVATLGAPALMKAGVPIIAAHMFVYFYAILSVITPPVCLAAFAGAAIAETNAMKTGVTAMKLGIVAFIIPFMFVFEPALLMQGSTTEIVTAFASALVGVIGVASGMQNWLLVRCRLWERALLLASGLMLIFPGLITDTIGLSSLLIVLFAQRLRRSGSPVAAA